MATLYEELSTINNHLPIYNIAYDLPCSSDPVHILFRSSSLLFICNLQLKNVSLYPYPRNLKCSCSGGAQVGGNPARSELLRHQLHDYVEVTCGVI